MPLRGLAARVSRELQMCCTELPLRERPNLVRPPPPLVFARTASATTDHDLTVPLLTTTTGTTDRDPTVPLLTSTPGTTDRDLSTTTTNDHDHLRHRPHRHRPRPRPRPVPRDHRPRPHDQTAPRHHRPPAAASSVRPRPAAPSQMLTPARHNSSGALPGCPIPTFDRSPMRRRTPSAYSAPDEPIEASTSPRTAAM